MLREKAALAAHEILDRASGGENGEVQAAVAAAREMRVAFGADDGAEAVWLDGDEVEELLSARLGDASEAPVES